MYEFLSGKYKLKINENDFEVKLQNYFCIFYKTFLCLVI